MAWQDFSPNELAVNHPITQELALKFDDRDRSLCEGTTLVKWAPVFATIGTDAIFGRTIVPRSASFMYVKCGAGVVAGPTTPSDPRMRIVVTDGVTTAYGDYLSLLNIPSMTRVQFPAVPIPAALRGQFVTLSIDAEDAVGSTLSFGIESDPSQPSGGPGVWFTGSKDTGESLYEIIAPGGGVPGVQASIAKDFVNQTVWTITSAEMIAAGFTSAEIQEPAYFTRAGGRRKANDKPKDFDMDETTFEVVITWPRKKSGQVIITQRPA